MQSINYTSLLVKKITVIDNFKVKWDYTYYNS